VRLLELVESPEGERLAPSLCRVHTVGDAGAVRELKLPPGLDDPAISADGQRVWWRTTARSLCEVDLSTGKVRREIRGSQGHVLDSAATRDAAGQRVLVLGRPDFLMGVQEGRKFPSALLVYDIAAERFVGRFLEPTDCAATRVLAPTGRYAIVRALVKTETEIVEELLVYDLATLPHDLDVPIQEVVPATQPTRP